MSDQRRALLEAIAFGRDPQITPSDRLRACEQLARCEDKGAPPGSFWGELSGLQGAELDGHLDSVLAPEIMEGIFGARNLWPQLGALVDREVEQRARTLADELHLDLVEAEIERRVDEELARRLAEARPEPVVPARESAMPPADPTDGARHGPRYQPQVGLRRRYRSGLLSA